MSETTENRQIDKAAIDLAYALGFEPLKNRLATLLIENAILVERERCAAVAFDHLLGLDLGHAASVVRAAIRENGNG